MTFNPYKNVKKIYYLLRLDVVYACLSFDIYNLFNFFSYFSTKNKELFEIGVVPRSLKPQVYMVAATEDYIMEFLPNTLTKMRANGSWINTDIVVGLISGLNSQTETASQLSKIFPEVEFVEIKCNFFEILSSFNCARFFLAQKTLKYNAECNILLTDIDVEVNACLDTIFIKHQNWNAIKTRRGRDTRFFCYAGCLLLCHNNKLEFLDDLCDRIQRRFFSRNWYTDQVSLWFSYKAFRNSFQVLPENLFSVESRDAILFAYKGNSKYLKKS